MDLLVISLMRFRSTATLALVIGLVLTAHALGSTPSESAKPNVLLIYTDDQGFGDCSYLNPDAKFETPNLDRLAGGGIALTNAHSADTVCTPSRYGLLTGRYCWRTKQKRGVLGAESECLIADGRPTIASILSQQGYDTAMVGKWHLGMDFPGEPGTRDWTKPVADMPLDKGFDHFFGIPASLNYGILAWFEGRYAKVPPTLYTAKKPNRRHMDYRIKPPYQSTPGETRALLKKAGFEIAPDFVDNQCLTRFTDEAIEWLKLQAAGNKSADDSKSPFFLYLPLTSPHYPVCPLPEFWGKGDCGGYGEFMIETDHHIGRLVNHLEKTGQLGNTIVIVTSDNGPEKSYRERKVAFGHHSNGDFRGGKRDIYEGGHRVPMIIHWPDGISQPGRRCDDLVGQVDVLATLATICGQGEHSGGEDSQSFASLLLNPEYQHKRIPLINHGSGGRFAITDQNWKLVMQHGKQNAELYNLSSDVSEQVNVASENPDRVEQLRLAITEMVKSGRSVPGDTASNDTGYWSDLTWMKPSDLD